MTDVMLKGLIKHIAQDLDIDLTPRQKKIIKFLSNKDISFMRTSDDLAQKFKVTSRTVNRDLKLLIDFKLVKRIKVPNQRKYYFKLNIDLLVE